MKRTLVIILLAVIVFVIPGCYKVATIQVDNSAAVTKAVSISKDIIPIFTKSCALSGCHGSGAHVPDLSASKAYSSLIKGNYISITEPANSTLYLWLTGKKSIKMPMGADNNPSNLNSLTLAWITQGAKNN
ncbi:MAG: hypothetical protein WCG87_09860 [Bacteroidota bacterium]